MRAERVDVGANGRTQGSLVSAWLDLPVKRPVVLVLVVLIVAAPAWLLADWLKNFALHPTDFIYVEEAIDARGRQKASLRPVEHARGALVPALHLRRGTVHGPAGRLAPHAPRSIVPRAGRDDAAGRPSGSPGDGAHRAGSRGDGVHGHHDGRPACGFSLRGQSGTLEWRGHRGDAAGDPCLAVQGGNLETGAGRDRSPRRAGNLVGRSGCWSSRRGSSGPPAGRDAGGQPSP